MQLPNFYEHYCPAKIIAGQRSLSNLPFEMGRFGTKRALVVIDEDIYKTGFIHLLEQAFTDSGLSLGLVFPRKNSRVTLAGARGIAELFRRSDCDCFIALGGGEAMDAVKSAAILVGANPAELPREKRFSMTLPKIFAVPVAYAPGYQVTNLVELYDEEKNRSLYFFSDDLIARLAVLDPKATLKTTASSRASYAMDALARSVEAIMQPEVNPIVLIYARAAIGLVVKNLEAVLTEDKRERQADQALANASLYAGIAFCHASRGLIAATAQGLNWITGMQTGIASSILLPHGFEMCCQNYAAQIGEAVGAFTTKGLPSTDDPVGAVRRSLKGLQAAAPLPGSLHEAGIIETELKRVVEVAQKTVFYSESLFNSQDVLALLEKAF
ncbi:MAG: iron-containing alcohol dehydrogenase [Syntrophobacteraceae bacterium]